MKIVLLIASTFLLTSPTQMAFAKGKHKHHKAHTHGDAKLSVAVDGKSVSLEFEAPGDVIFGFEHRAKTDGQKKIISDQLARLNDNPGEFFRFTDDAKCALKSKDIVAPQANDQTGKASAHADVVARYTFTCETDLKGKALSITLFKAWPRLKNLKTQIVGGSGQQGVTLKNDEGTIQL